MADKIRILMEDLLPDMLVLLKRNVFQKQEVTQIMKNRENHEYKFLRKTASEIEFLEAIEYEYSIERLRRQRFKEMKLKKIKQKDFSIVRRVVQLWDKITDKFKYRLDLWKQYLSFCYFLESKRLFFKAVTRAVQYNPNAIEFWYMAIYFEYEFNQNPFKARKIFHKLLKFKSNIQDVWIEYFKFEMNFFWKIIEREKQILSVAKSKKDIKEDNKQDGEVDEFKTDFISFAGNDNENDEQIDKLDDMDDSSPNQSVELLMSIYKLATTKFQKLEFIIKLLQKFQSENKDNKHSQLLKDLQQIIIDDTLSTLQQNQISDLENLTQFLIEASNLIERQDIFTKFKEIYEKQTNTNKSLIINGFLNLSLQKQQNKQKIDTWLQNKEFLKILQTQFEGKQQNLTQILDFLVVYQNQKLIQSVLNIDQYEFDVKQISLITKLLDKTKIILFLQNQMKNNKVYINTFIFNLFQHIQQKQDTLKILNLILDHSDLTNQENIYTIFALAIEKLILHKKEFAEFYTLFSQKVSNSSKLQEELLDKMLSYGSLCPLSAYELVLQNYDTEDFQLAHKIKYLFEKIQNWFKQELQYWKMYVRFQKDIDSSKCPDLLQNAMNISKIDHQILVQMYSDIMNNE